MGVGADVLGEFGVKCGILRQDRRLLAKEDGLRQEIIGGEKGKIKSEDKPWQGARLTS